MKPTIKIQYLISISLSLMVYANTFSQGTGNHITMFLQNCTQTYPDSLEFDLMAVSDGASASTLWPNAFQYGVNFNTAILNGGTVTAHYVSGTTQFPQLLGFHFPPSPVAGHIRIIQSAFTNILPYSMVIGQNYRVGRFVLGNSVAWAPNSSPNFSLQDTIVQCKTVCATLASLTAPDCPDAYYVTGTGNGQRALSVSCAITLSTNDLSSQVGIRIYPNLITGEGNIHISLQKNLSNGRVCILNALGEKVFEDVINGKEKTINCKLIPGFYFVQVSDGELQFTQKLVVQ